MKILLTNDDGIKAPGLRALIEGMPQDVQVCVIAPATERSASSHSISLGQKLRVEEFVAAGIRQYAVHGTPVDCVKFAVAEIKDFVPQLIISGVNQGANTGVSVYYSGTISAAREGLINGIPAVAVSLCSRNFNDFTASVGMVRKLIEGYRHRRLPPNVLLNVNIPAVYAGQIAGIKVTKQAASRFIEEFIAEEQHDGKKVYTLAGEIELVDPDGTSDEEAVSEGFISITPLKLDLTDYDSVNTLKDWISREKNR